MRPELNDRPGLPYLLVIQPDGSIVFERLPSPPPGDLHLKLHAAVDGYFETVPLLSNLGRDPAIAFCNADGKGRGLRNNWFANLLWADSLGFMPDDDYLVGPIAIVVGSNEYLGQL
jgi:hypothetical protein